MGKSIFEEQISRKPNLYPWTDQFIEAMHNGSGLIKNLTLNRMFNSLKLN